jgi:hypothetical protein
MTTPLNERIATLITHAETLADEAGDLHMHDITDRLRLLASRLAIDGELVDAAVRAAAFQHQRRAEKLVQLRAANQRVELELAACFPRDVAAAYLTTARVSPLETARFRLRRLTDAHRVALGDVVNVLETAVAEADRAIDESLAATATVFVARAAANGRGHRLRLELERSKASMLAVLPVESAAADRVRRRVVRTRRPDRDAFWQSWPTTEGAPVVEE